MEAGRGVKRGGAPTAEERAAQGPPLLFCGEQDEVLPVAFDREALDRDEA